ncbi:MAG: 3-hydroxyacyl-ACP dehydratase FabZ [Actinobacteria bacterium]|nr:3-hydroxyacyl-ACP dehydratase FabZ [Actinomycetota bacterium]
MEKDYLNKQDILRIIPHRPPFLFVDEVRIIEPGRSAIGKFTAYDSYEFFKGHFPQNPVLPGVIMVEASAQVGACLLLSMKEFEGKIAYFAGIDSFKFKRIVRPNETVEIEIELISVRGRFGKGNVRGRVNEEIAFEGIISFFVGGSDE